MKRTAAEAAQTRTSLLAAGLRLFSKRGYAGTSIDDIVTEAGVTRGALYHHFRAKADVWNTLMEQTGVRGQEISMQAVSEGGTVPDILRRVFVRQWAALEADPDLKAVMHLSRQPVAAFPELNPGRKRQSASSRALLDQLTDAMRLGIAAGELRADTDPATLAQAYLAFQDGAHHLLLALPDRMTPDSAEKLVDTLLKGMLPG